MESAWNVIIMHDTCMKRACNIIIMHETCMERNYYAWKVHGT